ncbi:MAG TPA: hypothetical protein PK655_03325 [archaeon]|jgi:NOL1/NOP2/fmu family ribosome biogenesis protein|nr:hypothetical protein [archaeon]HPV66455.1 hypothetical protein [archaeon]
MAKKLDEKTRKKLINYLESRFGIDSSFFADYLFVISGKSVSIIYKTRETQKIIENQIRQNFTISFGIEIFSNYKDYKPSSLGFSSFAKKQIKQNFVELTRNQTNTYFSGKEIATKDIKNKNLLSSGFVACVYGNHIIGTARFDKEKQIITPNISFVNEKTK